LKVYANVKIAVKPQMPPTLVARLVSSKNTI